jgi:hypothetical protein
MPLSSPKTKFASQMKLERRQVRSEADLGLSSFDPEISLSGPCLVIPNKQMRKCCAPVKYQVVPVTSVEDIEAVVVDGWFTNASLRK